MLFRSIVGGVDGSGLATSKSEIYDPVTGLFSPTNAMTVARLDASATLLGDGKVLITGGYEGDPVKGKPLVSAEIFNPETNSFEATDAMQTSRRNQVATLLNNNDVLISGGYNGDYLNAPEVYNECRGRFSTAGKMSAARRYPAAAKLRGGNVLVSGGLKNSSGESQDSAEIYDSKRNRFTPTANMNVSRGRHTATLLNSGDVLITGGIDKSMPLE